MSDGDETSRLGEFSERLHSDDIEVVCDALSDYQQAQADTRWGVENRYAPLDGEVLAVSRDLLDRAAELDEEHRERALSWALTMVWHLGGDEDVDRVADVLDGDPSPGLREEALLAASTAFESDAFKGGAVPNARLLAAVRAVALDESLDARDRGSAIHALGELDLPEVEELFIRLTASDDLGVQVSAAGQLARPAKIRAHRDLLQRLVDSWPEDAGPFSGDVRDAVEGFHSTYWKGTPLDDPALRQAHFDLRFPLGDEACLEAFSTLLRSDDPAAVGIALDHYASWEGLRSALSDGDLADARLPEVLERAREVLRRPISPAEVSALNVIGAEHATPDDAGLVVDVLSRTDSGAVRREALWVAGGVLGRSDTPDPRLVEAATSLVFDGASQSGGTRETAIRILAEGLGARADDVLLRALREGDPDTRARAARYLVKTGALDRHRAVMEEAAERWEENPPARFLGRSPADLILGTPHSVHWEGHRLPDPDLHRAHRRLRLPTADASYHEAMRTMLHSDDPAAVGIALDHWWDADGAVARGGEEARGPARALVAALIPGILRRPLVSPEPGRAHLSALSALSVAAQDDLPLLAEVLDQAGPVRGRVLEIARDVLWSLGESHPRLVQALGDVASNETVPADERSLAARLLEEFRCDNTDDVLAQVRGVSESLETPDEE
ncbi:hypothetical protein [Actinomadura harenae]|uniref:HEAT repeat domain-containing protein n=1 Tax=Actinomadura harenae TaxID=2483351 RepID=A0A3M2LUB6_9ACTN|nr:hypothetical protein [Actinomadura harenae]RMI40987.1 hypothetical protein EBO15_24570 [Actinomadura harenae]